MKKAAPKAKIPKIPTALIIMPAGKPGKGSAVKIAMKKPMGKGKKC
jgi:hypothetical protein